MSIKKDLAELVDSAVISQETADNIRSYYAQKSSPSQHKLFLIFAILGALLIGLGLILIIAHNWDNLSVLGKTVLAFVPLILSQITCGYTLLKKQLEAGWRESSSTLLFLSIGASISLISQIYHIPGNISAFLLTWLLLGLPLIYLMRSSFTSILYIAGVAVYSTYSNYWTYPHEESYRFWFLFLAIAPYYYSIYRKKASSHWVSIHHWLMAISIPICLGTVIHKEEEIIFVAYMNLFCLFTLLGHALDQRHPGKSNAYIWIGQVGAMLLLLAFTFNDLCDEIRAAKYTAETFLSPEFIASIITAALAIGLTLYKKKEYPGIKLRPLETVFLYFTGIFLLALFSPMTALFSNILFLTLSIQVIREGIGKEHLGITNLGLLMITALIVCRFFDTNLPFAVRGILFLLVGIGFFVTNYFLIKKRNG